jgi:hypothetical protein
MPSLDTIKDRRAAARVPVEFPIELSDLSYLHRGAVVNLSTGGALMRTPAPLGARQEYDLLLRPEGEPPLKLEGRVVHAGPAVAGIAFRTQKAAAFEAAYNLFESIVMRKPALAIRLKQRPQTLSMGVRLYPMPLKGAVLSGPEHWVYGHLKAGNGSLLSDVRKALGGEWDRVAYVPFALLERGVVSLAPQT